MPVGVSAGGELELEFEAGEGVSGVTEDSAGMDDEVDVLIDALTCVPSILLSSGVNKDPFLLLDHLLRR